MAHACPYLAHQTKHVCWISSSCKPFQARYARKLKKTPRDTGQVSPGHPTGTGQTGVYRLVFHQRFFSVLYHTKLTEKGIVAGTPAGCARDTRLSRVHSDTLCDFFLCAFSSLRVRALNRASRPISVSFVSKRQFVSGGSESSSYLETTASGGL